MKIALLNCPSLLHSREEALLKTLQYIPYAAKAGCACLFLPKKILGKNEGEEDRSLPILEKRSSFYGVTLGLGYQSEKEDGYLLFCPEPKFIPFGEGCDFEEKGNAWKILKNEKEDPGDAFSLLFCSDVRLDSLRGRVVTKKDCFCFADGAHFSCGVFRNGRLLCAIPEGKAALLVKEVTL